MKKLLLVSAILMLVLTFKTEAFSRTNGVDFNFFYSSLSPYGEWVEIDYDVYAWRPVGVRRHWTPYTDGRWVWTNHGWYWDSYEPFGWATFHYGRWYYDDYYGWMWLPDNEWGPAWVDWRYDDDYIGWSPLPPYARFGIDFGIHFSIDWIAPIHYWSFVRYNHFCGHDIHGYIVGDNYKNNIYKHTKYRNDYGYRDGRVINRGVDRDFVERRSGNKISERELVNTSRLRSNSERGRDTRIEVYRPSDDAVKKTRNIEKFEVRKSERNTNLDLRKVEKERIVRPDNKNTEKVTIRKENNNSERNKKADNNERVIIRKESKNSESNNRVENNNKVNVEKNVNRNDERSIQKSRESQNDNKISKDNRTIKKQNNNEVKSDSRDAKVNKSQNESRTIQKRSTENKSNEIRNVERPTKNSKPNNSDDNERTKIRKR